MSYFKSIILVIIILSQIQCSGQNINIKEQIELYKKYSDAKIMLIPTLICDYYEQNNDFPKNQKQFEVFLANKKTDLYITDLLLDDMDGLSLIEEMRSIEPNAEIIALLSDTSALSNVVLEGGLDLNAEAVRKMAIESGAHAVFISPFNLGELVEAIHRLSETRTC